MVKYGFAQKRISFGHPPTGAGWKQVAAKKPAPSFAKAGVEYRFQGKWIRHIPIKSGERILGIALGLLCSTFSLGLAPVFSKRVVRWITGRQVLRVFQKVMKVEHKPAPYQPLPFTPLYVPPKPHPRPTPHFTQSPTLLSLSAPIVAALHRQAPIITPPLALPAPIVTIPPQPKPFFTQAQPFVDLSTPIEITFPRPAPIVTQAKPLLALPAPIVTSPPQPKLDFTQAQSSLPRPIPALPKAPPFEPILYTPVIVHLPKLTDEGVTEFLQHCGKVVDALFAENNPQELVKRELAYIGENREIFRELTKIEEHWKIYRSVIALLMGSLSHEQRVDFAYEIGNILEDSFEGYPKTQKEVALALAEADAELPPSLALAIEWRLIEGIEQDLLYELPIEKISPVLEHLALHQAENLEIPDANGNTLLHHAIGQGKTPLACLLIRLGVSLQDKNENRATPVDLIKDLSESDRHLIVQEIISREIVEKQDEVKEAKEEFGVGAGLSKKIRLGKHLNKIGLWNKKWIRKRFHGKAIADKWVNIGSLFDFTARIYKLYEEETRFEAVKDQLNQEYKQIEALANQTEDPMDKATLLKRLKEKQAALYQIQHDIDEAKRKGVIDVAESAAPFGAQILRFIPKTADSVARWMPGLSALTSGIAVYKGWEAIQEMDDKIKTMQQSFEQLKKEQEQTDQLRSISIPDSLIERVLRLKSAEIGTKMQFLEGRIGQADLRKQVEEWANWATWFKYVPMAAAYVFPPVGVAALAVGAVGFSTVAVDAYQYWENYGQMNENDFAPLVVADYEQRLPVIAMRLGKPAEQLKGELDEMMKGMHSQEQAWLCEAIQHPFKEGEDSEAELRAGILNYILN